MPRVVLSSFSLPSPFPVCRLKSQGRMQLVMLKSMQCHNGNTGKTTESAAAVYTTAGFAGIMQRLVTLVCSRTVLKKKKKEEEEEVEEL
ncbi:hypothetical protein TcWFU_010258 [Taenia crassiceps]|uniref:Uncharacterized protein n=1 Tax=Taenia crassiceps TaxID=6207 RepID=A0ABR4QMJ1_9CEST